MLSLELAANPQGLPLYVSKSPRPVQEEYQRREENQGALKSGKDYDTNDTQEENRNADYSENKQEEHPPIGEKGTNGKRKNGENE